MKLGGWVKAPVSRGWSLGTIPTLAVAAEKEGVVSWGGVEGDRKPGPFRPESGQKGPPTTSQAVVGPAGGNRVLLTHPSSVRRRAHRGLVPGGQSLSPLLGKTFLWSGQDPAKPLGPQQDRGAVSVPWTASVSSHTGHGSFGEEAAASVLTSLNIFRPLQFICSFERPLKITLPVRSYWVPALGPALC